MKYTTSYTFTSNMGDVTFSASGDYYSPVPSRDIDVEIASGEYREFNEVDEGGVDEIFEWLRDCGVEFPDTRALWFNVHILIDLLVNREGTEEQLLDEAASLSSEELSHWREVWGL